MCFLAQAHQAYLTYSIARYHSDGWFHSERLNQRTAGRSVESGCDGRPKGASSPKKDHFRESG